MNYNKISILFLLQKARVNKQRKCPIRCRITYQQKRKEFSLGVFVNLDYWNSKKQKAIPPNKDNEFINKQLSLIKLKINQAFLFLQVNNDKFDVEDIYLQYIGENIKANKTFLEVFDSHNTRIEKLLGIEYTKSTYNKFVECRNLIIRFTKHQYKGYHAFKRYIAIGITAYNLKRIGRELLKQEREALKRQKKRAHKIAAKVTR